MKASNTQVFEDSFYSFTKRGKSVSTVWRQNTNKEMMVLELFLLLKQSKKLKLAIDIFFKIFTNKTPTHDKIKYIVTKQFNLFFNIRSTNCAT